MARSQSIIVGEFKNYRIGGNEMDKIIGSAIRARRRNRPAVLLDVVLWCRGFTPEADRRARELEQELNLQIHFKVIP